MADTSVQVEVADWVRDQWMPSKFGRSFHREKVTLESSGVYDFDAVSDDRTTVASISTSAARTASGKLGTGKLHKIRSDMYFLLMAPAARRLVILTQRDMYDECLREAEKGRISSAIEFELVELPAELRNRLALSQMRASKEVTPSS